ncbi:MAG: DUF4070 domain-containing protein, partial [Candidatus Sumerlaeota bacterium]|nr:DUF4070 domain-containing protein [Candidatus Sumerlaeota bacterium]
DCEFCDITALFGRKPRYKTPAQLAAELDALYALGWRRGIFLADDNFIADRRAAWDLAQTLQAWQAARGFPYAFTIQASLNLGRDSDLLKLLAAAGVNAVFLGIASPDEASLRQTRKTVNLRHPLDESVEAIVRAGMRPLGGMILGFDGEEPGAGRRIVDLIDRLAIPESTLMMLQALPQTALWRRLETEGRLRAEGTALDQTQLTNFQPTRPLRELATEFVEAFWQLYDPKAHLDRTHRCFRRMGAPPFKRRPQRPSWAKLRDLAVTMRALATVVWRQGVLRSTRWKFWLYLADILLHNPRVCGHYLSVCAHEEHFLPFRAITRDQILSALAAREAEPAAPSSRPTTPVAAFPR